MFNLANLNDYEFELLCKDIMQAKLGCSLYTFPKGPDGGVDICDSKKDPNIIIQAKHYINSKYSDLLRSLKNEVPKVQKLYPKEYYICSGLKLTKKQKNEIFLLFQDYMKDCSYIVDSIEIDDFLSEQENVDIVNKHYKLWLCSSSVLSLINNKNVFIDCEELICDIEKEAPLFVQTNTYFQAKKKLQGSGVIILVGAPGVGKSTISKMLLLCYANEGYAVRYTSDNDISSIKKALSINPNKKEIILLDDFLGQHYLKIKDSQPNELKTLLSNVKKNPNKKIILNSRITIINEAAQSYINFKALMDENKGNEYLIDIDKMSNLEKAKILYNHIYFHYLPKEYILQIKNNKNYFRIIKHKNYNPRIIEYVTMENSYRKVLPNKYFEYIIAKLDNPEDVWRDEFRNRLSEPDRVLINTLYSLTNTWIDISILERSFNSRIRNLSIDTSINTFKNVINRLGNSLLKLTEERGKIKVAAINPSINDYVNADITANVNEQLNIVIASTYIEQILKVAKTEESKQLVMKLLFSGKLLKMECLYNSPFFYFIKIVIDNKIYDSSLEKNLKFSLEHLNIYHIIEVDDYSDMICEIMSTKFIQFYHIEDILLNSSIMYYILSPIEYELFEKITDLYIDALDAPGLSNCKEYNNVMEVFHDYIVEKLCVVAKEKAEENLYKIISDRIDEFEDEHGDLDEEALEESSISKTEEDIEYYIDSEIGLFNDDLQLKIEPFDIDSIIRDIDFGDAINSVKQARYADYDNDEHMSDWKSEYDEICYIFER